jgi:hypothetical protein
MMEKVEIVGRHLSESEYAMTEAMSRRTGVDPGRILPITLFLF